MLSLTKDQIDFLRRHKVPLSKVFDATGMKRKTYSERMREEEKIIVIGVTPCEKDGHTMRARSGNCVQCNPADLGFATRHYKNAYVYVSASLSASLIKVGLAKSPDERERLLNARGYGGITDWSKIGQVKCSNAGKVEYAVQEALAEFAAPRRYFRGTEAVDCLEIFACGYPRAREALLDVITDEEAKTFWQRKDADLNYNFVDRRGGDFVRGGRAT